MLRSNLPEPVYVAVVKSITGLLPSKFVGIIIVVVQAAVVAYSLQDTTIAVVTAFTAAAAIPRLIVLASWSRHQGAVRTGCDAARWELVLAVANLPTAFGIGLITATTIAQGAAEWSMVEVAVVVGFVSTYIAAAGVRPSVGTAHFVAALAPCVAICAWIGDVPHLLLALLAVLLIQTWREYQRASYNALVAQITLEQKASEDARQDPLTTLGNRLAFSERLNELEKSGAPFTLFLLDLDGFKQVNDHHGHSAGDFVLKKIAVRMRLHLADGAVAFRLGGDEFAVLTPTLETQDVIATIIEDCAKPMKYRARHLQISTSVGAATGPHPDLVGLADDALYAAKTAGKNCWRASIAFSDAA